MFAGIFIDNPYGGEETGRSVDGSQLSIYYAGSSKSVDLDAAQRLGNILSRSGQAVTAMGFSMDVAAEVTYSARYGTWLTQNGRGFASTGFAGNQYFYRGMGGPSSRAAAMASSKALSSAARGFAAVSVGIAGYDFLQSDISVSSGARFSSEIATTAYSAYGGIYGMSFGLGWEGGRLISMTGGYQRFKRDTVYPWRARTLGY